MGTNYYLEAPAACECCGRPYERLHIGKSSFGWCFALHVIPELYLNNLEDWVIKLTSTQQSVVDEYGEEISIAELLHIICNRQYGGENGCTDDTVASMGAERGPNGLLRHRVDGVHCVGHGPGTWDYIAGEFS